MGKSSGESKIEKRRKKEKMEAFKIAKNAAKEGLYYPRRRPSPAAHPANISEPHATCRLCPKLGYFWSFEAVEEHALNDHSELEFRCEKCSNPFDSLKAQMEHEKDCKVGF